VVTQPLPPRDLAAGERKLPVARDPSREGGNGVIPAGPASRWLLLVYTVPREPSANRVSIWRKLKRLGALLLHDAVWVLPSFERTREQLQWLAEEIRELGGEALVWQASLAADGQDEQLVQRFTARVDELYREVLADLNGAETDLVGLARRYQQTKLVDYFHSPVGDQVRDALLAAGGREQS
jgi:hypothetical protein